MTFKLSNFTLLFYILLICPQINAQHEKAFSFFPEGISYNADFPAPASILGFEIGTQHITHDQLVAYMKEMARLSDRITLTEIGRTYENRPLIFLTITSLENQANIDQIRKQHLALSDPDKSADIDISNMPAVILLGHSVHGNEPSAGNSSLLTVYHWAAAQGAEIDQILANTIILVDPCLNPDGFQRFSTWANSNKGHIPSADPIDREHNEAWPGGRTNHYWFDLNRDWLPAQHPESQARLKNYHSWKPNIQTDHHEMGGNSSFFFMPGIPSRNHPLIPDNSISLVNKIAKYHARELDKIGSYYFSEENFDNFYFGKGSTYPDLNAAIGILFEQGSIRGIRKETSNGVITFPFAIRNQFTVAYSSVLAAQDLRLELLEHQRNFYKTAIQEAKNDPIKAYIWSAGEDQSKANLFLEMLNYHDLEVYQLASDYDGMKKEKSFILPSNQANYRMVKALFERRTQFQDSLFYDISAWTFQLAMDLDFKEVSAKKMPSNLIGNKVKKANWEKGSITKSDYAYVLPWDDFYAPKALNMMLTHNLKVKVANSTFGLGTKNYDRGSILIPVNIQKFKSEQVFEILSFIAKNTGIKIEALNTGNTKGVRLGSSSFANLRDPKVAILTDGGISSYEAGEVWHLLDYRMEMQVTLLPVNRFNRADLSKYNTIVIVGGRYNDIDSDKLKSWVQQGGLVIATRTAGKWLSDKKLTNVSYKSREKTENPVQLPYSQQRNIGGAQVIGGAIFNTKTEITHPLLYGINDKNLAIFRRGTLFMEVSKNPFGNPLVYTEQPLLAGYSSKPNLKALAGTSAVAVNSLGRGKIISFANDPIFRAYWYGTNKLFLNAVFFGHTISSRSTR